jgi:hypothetical protein
MIQFENKKGDITTSSGAGSTLEIDCIGFGSVGIDVRGTFTATLVPEGTIDNINYFTLTINPVAGTAGVTSITAAGAWTVNTSGLSKVRLRCSAYTSGTANASLVATIDSGINNNIAVSLATSDIEIGAVELKNASTDDRASIEAANTARTTATKVIAVQHVDAAGNVLPASPVLGAGTAEIGKLAAGTALIGKVSIDQVTANANEVVTKTGSVTTATLAAGTALAGIVSASSETSTVYNGTTALTPKFVIIDAATSGDNTILAAVASKKIRVLSLFLIAAGTTTVRFESGAGGTALTGQMNLTAQSGFTLPFNPIGWFETASNTLLNLELNAAVSVDGCLTYVEV